MKLTILVAFASLAILSQPSKAFAASTCTLDGLQDRTIELLTPKLQRVDLKAPPTTQTTAPASATSTTTTTDSPERAHWLALAIEQGFASNNGSGGVTVSLSPVEWLENLKPEGYFDNNRNFREVNYLRSLTGSLSLGNRGDALDLDGDGMPAEPAEAESLGDSILLELQYRWGTRDRREAETDKRFRKRYKNDLEELESLQAKLTEAYRTLLSDPDFDGLFVPYFAAGSPDAARCDEIAANAAAKFALLPRAKATEAVVLADNAVRAKMNEIAFKIDNSWVWSVAVSALERDDYLGADRIGVSFRGLKGMADPGVDARGRTWLMNLDISEEDTFVAGADDLRAATLRLEYVGAFSPLRLGKFGQARWAVSLAGEKNWNAPAAARTSELVAGLRLEVPVAENISVPFSLKWSNRNELLEDEDEIVGHVGISFDFDAFFSGG